MSKYSRLLLSKNPLGYWRGNEQRTLDYLNAVLLKTPAGHYRLAEVPAITTYAASVLARSPVGYWRLGESSGTTATDSSGNGRNGTYQETGATDTYSRANSDTTLGSTEDGGALGLGGPRAYVVEQGTWGISGGLAYSVTSANEDRVYVDTGVVNGTFAVDMRHVTLNSAWATNLNFRMVDNNTRLSVALTGGLLYLIKVAGGAVSVLASPAYAISADTPYTVSVTANGAAITVSVNGVQQISYTLTGGDVATFTATNATRVGYRVYTNGGSAPLRFDNLRVTPTTLSVTLAQPGALSGDTDTAALFDGSSGYVTRAAVAPSTTAFTVELWQKNTLATASGLACMIGNGSPGGGAAGCVELFKASGGNGVLAQLYGAAGLHALSSSTPINTGAWFHLVLTWDGATLRYYVNGTLDASAAAVDTFPAPSGVLNLALRANGSFPFAGTLDEVAIYPTALSAAVISEHYSVGRGNFSQYNGVVAADASGNNRNGAYVGGGASAASTLVGDSNTAYNTQGTGYVELPNNTALHPGDVFAVAFRFKRSATLGTRQQVISAGVDDYGVYFGTDNKIYAEKVGTGDIASSILAYTDTNAHEFMWVHNGTSDSFYIDGVSAQTNILARTVVAASSVIGVGAAYNGSSPFNGTLDEVTVYGPATAITFGDHKLRTSVGQGNTNQLAGLTASDSSGNNQGGVYDVGVEQGGQPGALRYDSDSAVAYSGVGLSGSRVIIPDGVINGTAGTLIAWVKTIDTDGGVITRNTYRIGIGPARWSGVALHIAAGKAGIMVGGGYAVDTVTVSSSASVNDDTYHMLAATWGGGVLKLYVDGVLVGTAPYTTILMPLPPSTYIAYGSQFGELAGTIDEVASLGYALTADEINELFLAAFQQEAGGISAACFAINESLVYFRPDGQRVILHSPPVKAVLSQEGFGMPPLQYVADQAPFQHGDTVRSFTLQPRPIQLTIIQNFTARANYRAGRASLLDAIRPNRVTDFNTPGSLRYYLADGTKRQIDVLIESGPGFAPPEGGWREWSFTEVLRFVAHDPVWYEPTQRTVDFTTASGSCIFPVTFPVTFGGFGGQSWIGYSGTWLEYPTFTVTGPITGLVIQNVTTGDKLELAYTLPAGFIATISLRGVKTITRNDGVNLLNYLSSDSGLASFAIVPSPQAQDGLNLIRVSGSGSTSTTAVRMTYYNRYIGI